MTFVRGMEVTLQSHLTGVRSQGFLTHLEPQSGWAIRFPGAEG